MSRLPLPNRGQPIDTAYIYDIVRELNALSEEGSALAQGNNFSFTGKDSIPRSARVYGAQIFAGIKSVASQNASTAESYSVTFNFQPGFIYPPVVQATLENAGDTRTPLDATVTVQNVTTTTATAVVRFARAGSFFANVHLTAIGLPIS
jgi:hypothetical protein